MLCIGVCVARENVGLLLLSSSPFLQNNTHLLSKLAHNLQASKVRLAIVVAAETKRRESP